MPCSYYTIDEELSMARRELDKVTRVACDMWKQLRKTGHHENLPIEALEWGQEHDKRDAERVKAQEEKKESDERRKAAKSSALAKLTKEELKALGILI